MIEQYLANTNEIATVLILPKILKLNKALISQYYCTCRRAKSPTPRFFVRLKILSRKSGLGWSEWKRHTTLPVPPPHGPHRGPPQPKSSRAHRHLICGPGAHASRRSLYNSPPPAIPPASPLPLPLPSCLRA